MFFRPLSFGLIFIGISASDNHRQANVTCGSLLKLLSPKHEIRLHSHDVRYGSGSTQQSVTGQSRVEDSNSYWMLQGPIAQPCVRGAAVKCGQLIRLQHVKTSCLLHSHLYPSPLSNQQEVSCYGKNGVGDSGDIWVLDCPNTPMVDAHWTRPMEVSLKHRDTNMWLAATEAKFSHPIQGQSEICASKERSLATLWTVAEGIFVLKSNADVPVAKDDL